ncbi:MAG: hypothetical protein DRP15_01835 [Candidatus Aenigmatarchaeota archaeon]|nr:MAG: hypothetical protein DRP15_01835 [Candidatus Aenigmarchaeota archaeon]
MKRHKAQTSAILIILVIVIFIGVAVTLLQLAKTVSKEEYINLYTGNLLRSVLKTDTGHTQPECRKVSDLLACAFFTPTYRCSPEEPPCLELANETITNYMSKFDMIRKNFNYLFKVESEGFIAATDSGIIDIKIGDERLDIRRGDSLCRKQRCWTANDVIQRTDNGEQYILKVQLIISKR